MQSTRTLNYTSCEYCNSVPSLTMLLNSCEVTLHPWTILAPYVHYLLSGRYFTLFLSQHILFLTFKCNCIYPILTTTWLLLLLYSCCYVPWITPRRQITFFELNWIDMLYLEPPQGTSSLKWLFYSTFWCDNFVPLVFLKWNYSVLGRDDHLHV